MEQIGLAFLLFAAFWVGCAAGFIAMRLRVQVAYEKGRSDAAAEIATLTERVNTRDQQLAELRQRVEAAPPAAAPEAAPVSEWIEPLKESLERVESLLQAQTADQPSSDWVEPLKGSLERVELLLVTNPATAPPASDWVEPLKNSLERVESLLHTQVAIGQPALPAADWVEPLKSSLERVESLLQANAQPAQPAADWIEPIKTSLDRVETLLQSNAASAQPSEPTAEWLEPLKGSLERVEALLQASAANAQSAQPVNEWVEPIKTSLDRLESLVKTQADSGQPAAEWAEPIKTALDRVESLLQARAASGDTTQPAGDWIEPIKTSLERVETLLQTQAEAAAEAQASAGQWADPIKLSLERVDSRIAELEKERTVELTTLRQQVETLMQSQAALVSALRAPAAPGAWGEVQLRRIVEMTGMLQNCDFIESPALEGAAVGQPGLLVRLPNRRHIVIDSQVSLSALSDANPSASEDDRAAGRRQFAGEIRAHVARLGAPAYWDQFAQKPEFVVAFLPGEGLFGAALEGDPGLLEYGVEHRVLLATPATLIALLRAVAWGWKQELATADVLEIRDLGQTLYQQLTAAAAEFAGVQQSMAATTIAFNRAFGSFESGVMPSARRLRELAPTSAASLQHLASAAKSSSEGLVKVL